MPRNYGREAAQERRLKDEANRGLEKIQLAVIGMAETKERYDEGPYKPKVRYLARGKFSDSVIMREAAFCDSLVRCMSQAQPMAVPPQRSQRSAARSSGRNRGLFDIDDSVVTRLQGGQQTEADLDYLIGCADEMSSMIVKKSAPEEEVIRSFRGEYLEKYHPPKAVSTNVTLNRYVCDLRKPNDTHRCHWQMPSWHDEVEHPVVLVVCSEDWQDSTAFGPGLMKRIRESPATKVVVFTSELGRKQLNGKQMDAVGRRLGAMDDCIFCQDLHEDPGALMREVSRIYFKAKREQCVRAGVDLPESSLMAQVGRFEDYKTARARRGRGGLFGSPDRDEKVAAANAVTNFLANPTKAGFKDLQNNHLRSLKRGRKLPSLFKQYARADLRGMDVTLRCGESVVDRWFAEKETTLSF